MDISTFEITCIIGAILILGTSWEKYQQPSNSGKMRHLYERFRPQLVTSNIRYYASMTVYNLLMLGIYSLIILVKDSEAVINALGFENSKAAESLPLIAAMAVMGAQNVPYINKLEAIVRRCCHAWAKIPRGIRQTKDEIAFGDFSFDEYKSDAALASDQLRHVSTTDFVKAKATTEWKWARISCVLFSLERARKDEATKEQFSKSDFDAILFEEYEEEYGQLLQNHRALGEAVKSFKEKKNSDPDWKGSDDYRMLRLTLHNDMRSLDEQLVSFVASAVRSKQSTESQVKFSLAKIGFKLADSLKSGISSDSTIIVLGIIFTIVVATVCFSQETLFNQSIKALSEQDKPIPQYVPQQMLDALIWAVFTIVSHGAAIAGSHYYRRWAIRREFWPKWADPQERARVNQYFCATVAGCISGTVVLFVLGIANNYLAEKTNVPTLHQGDLLTATAIFVGIWGLVYGVTAFFTAFHLDTKSEAKSNISKWATVHALAALLVTYVTSTIFIDKYHQLYNFDEVYSEIGMQFKLTIIAMVILISLAMAILIPYLHVTKIKKEQARKNLKSTYLEEENMGYTAELGNNFRGQIAEAV